MFTMDFVLYIVSIFLLSLSIMHFRSSVLLLILYSIYIQMLSTDVFESNIMLRVFFFIFYFFVFLFYCEPGTSIDLASALWRSVYVYCNYSGDDVAASLHTSPARVRVTRDSART